MVFVCGPPVRNLADTPIEFSPYLYIPNPCKAVYNPSVQLSFHLLFRLTLRYQANILIYAKLNLIAGTMFHIGSGVGSLSFWSIPFPKGSQDPNNRVLEPKYYNINGRWALKPYYFVLGPLGLTLNPIHPRPLGSGVASGRCSQSPKKVSKEPS